MTEKLKEKVVLITGAAGGLGLTTSLLFSKEGAKTIIMTDNNEDQVKEAAMKVIRSVKV